MKQFCNLRCTLLVTIDSHQICWIIYTDFFIMILGAHLPTPPPIPEAILRSLEVIRKTQPQAAGFQQPAPAFQFQSQPSRFSNTRRF